MVLVNNIEAIPLTNLNVRVLKYSGFLFMANWRTYAVIVSHTVLNCCEIFHLFQGNDTMDGLIRNGFETILVFTALFRAVQMSLRRSEYEELLEYLRELYNDLQNFKDIKIQEILQECSTAGVKFSRWNFLMGSSACLGLFTYPIFVSKRVLPFDIYVPYLDESSFPWYQIFYVMEIVTCVSGMCTFMPFTNIMACHISFAISICKVLHYKLGLLETMPKEKIEQELIVCIGYQLKLERFVQKINSLTSNIFLIEYLLFGIMLCAMMFLLIMVENIIQIIIISGYIFMVFAQSSVLYYYANDLYDQSLAIAAEVYNTNWYEYERRVQKMLVLFMLRAQKPCGISIGSVYSMNLARLQALLNISYSFFTVLKRVYR